NGEAIEDVNILGVRSTAKYGYNYSLPVAIAKNAANDAIAYEGFENLYTYNSANFFEDSIKYDNTKGTRSTMVAHTGKYSVNLTNNQIFNVASLRLASSALWNNLWNAHNG